MILTLPKGEPRSLSAHFASSDFDCHCNSKTCVYTLVDGDLVDSLESLWGKVGSIWVASGFRCTYWNHLKGGKPGSFHLLGKASDAHPGKKTTVSEMRIAALQIPLFEKGGIGTYETFLHLDVRGYKSRWGTNLS